jgi:enediyne biosynthesis protein E4
VTVTAGGRAQTKVNDGNSGYLSRSTMPLYFGLGSATAADRVDVLWPSGKRQTVQSPPAGRPLEIREN